MSGVSDITVAALTATPTLRGNKLAWTYSDPRNGALPNIALDMVEVHASTTNDRTTAAKVGDGITDFTHSGLVEEQTYYYWIKARDYLPSAQGGPGYGAWHPSGSTSGVACVAQGISGLVYGLANGKLVVTVSGNAMTVAIKTAAGNDPSASDPVFIAFPNATLTIGNYQVRSITAALSVTVSNGSRMGTDNSTAFRVWFPLFDDAGTLRLGASVRTDSSGALYGLSSGGRASSTAEGGAGAADTVGVIYTGTAVTDKQYFLIGYADWNSGLATAGVWSAGPDAVRLAGSGIDRPGQALFEVAGHPPYTPSITYTNLIPWDDTPPRSNEGGALYGPLSVTAQAPMNAIEVECVFTFTHSVASEFILSLIKNISGVTDCIGSAVEYVAAADKPVQVHLKFRTIAGGTSLTFNIQGGAVVAGTTTVGGVSGARKLGGTMNHYFKYQEFAA